jgi:AbrB family looped-hinge helix DNA binding protein
LHPTLSYRQSYFLEAAVPARTTTQLSTRGQVVLPKPVRERHGWRPGDTFVVEDRPEGVFLRRAEERVHTRYEDVAGCLGPAKRKTSVEEISSVSPEYVRKRWGHEYDDLD